MAEGRFTDEEQQLILYLRAKGKTFKEIGQHIGRHPSSVCRYCTGERGEIRRFARKPWRCHGCGGLQLRKECLTCKTRRQQENDTAFKNRQSATQWHKQITSKHARRCNHRGHFHVT